MSFFTRDSEVERSIRRSEKKSSRKHDSDTFVSEGDHFFRGVSDHLPLWNKLPEILGHYGKWGLRIIETHANGRMTNRWVIEREKGKTLPESKDPSPCRTLSVCRPAREPKMGRPPKVLPKVLSGVLSEIGGALRSALELPRVLLLVLHRKNAWRALPRAPRIAPRFLRALPQALSEHFCGGLPVLGSLAGRQTRKPNPSKSQGNPCKSKEKRARLSPQ